MDSEHSGARPESAGGSPARDENPSSGIARREGEVDGEAGGPVDAALRGDPGTPRAMGLGSEPAPNLDDPEATLDAGDGTD